MFAAPRLFVQTMPIQSAGVSGRGNRRSWPPLSHLLEAGVRGEGEGKGEERTNTSLHKMQLACM